MDKKRQRKAVEVSNETQESQESIGLQDSQDINEDNDNDNSNSTKSNREPHVRDIITPKPWDNEHKYCKLMSWNVAGLRGILNKNATILQDLVDKHDPDVFTLQETKLQSAEGYENHLPGYHSYWSCSKTKKGYAGTVIFVKKSISVQSNDSSSTSSTSSPATTKKTKQMTLAGWAKPKSDVSKIPAADSSTASSSATSSASASSSSEKNDVLSIQSVKYEFDDAKFSGEGRTITVDLGLFYVIGCYVPNSGQNLERLDYRVKEWDPYMRKYLSSLQQKKPVVFMGDLNVGHLDLDIHNPTAKHIVKQSGLTPVERNSMTEFLSSGFTDAFRFLYPDSRGQFTYWSQRMMSRPVNRGIRLDYFVCSDDMFGKKMITENSQVEDNMEAALPSPDEKATGKRGRKSSQETTTSSSIMSEPAKQLEPIEHTDAKIPYVYDSYILYTDTIGLSDHCPVVLVVRIK